GEIVHACAKLFQAVNVVVVGDHSGDGRKQSGGSGDESFRNSRRDGAQGGCSSIAESLKSINDAPDGAEQTDERRDGSRGCEQRQAALEARELFRRCDLSSAVHSRDVGLALLAI